MTREEYLDERGWDRIEGQHKPMWQKDSKLYHLSLAVAEQLTVDLESIGLYQKIVDIMDAEVSIQEILG